MMLASSSGGSWGQWEESSFPGLWHPPSMEWLLVLSQPTSPEKRREFGSFSTETQGRKVPCHQQSVTATCPWPGCLEGARTRVLTGMGLAEAPGLLGQVSRARDGE